ncbi:unnamed protein product, partial [Mesorhabditis spiculigera]
MSTKPVAEIGLDLVRELRRNCDIIPSYEGEKVRDCLNGINALYSETYEQLQRLNNELSGSDAQNVTIETTVRSKAIQFAYRCLLAYHHERIRRIKALRWKFGGNIPSRIKSNLNESELEFFNSYCQNLADFQSSFGGSGMNLLACTRPPEDLYVQVKVLQDYGDFETTDGTTITLTTNSIHNLLQQDCEMLIRQGVLERII